MPHRYITVSGLWEKDTKAGKVLSCKMTSTTKDKLKEALTFAGDDAELVVFTARERKSEKSPTHNLCIRVPELDAPKPEDKVPF